MLNAQKPAKDFGMVQETGGGAEEVPHGRKEGSRVELHQEERGQKGTSEKTSTA